MAFFSDPHLHRTRPSTGTAAARVAGRVARLERLARKVASATQPGQAPTVRLGPGIDRAEARAYHPGDDVRHIDWAGTARVNDVLVRDTLAEHERVALVVLDAAPSLRFGTSGMSKYDTATVLALAFAAVAVRTGERAQAVRGGDSPRATPVVTGPSAVHQLARFLSPEPEAGSHVVLADALRLAARGSSGKLVVVASDFATPGFEPTLRALCQRHAVVALQVSDRREHELSDIGTAVFTSGDRQFTVPTGSSAFRAKFAAHAASVHAARTERLQRTGAAVVPVRATDDLPTLIAAARRMVEVVK